LTEPKYRKSLNKSQLDILLTLYKFRFLTRDLWVDYTDRKTGSYEYFRLLRLVDQGYIGRHYTRQDSIDRNPAVYFALPDGIKALKRLTDLEPTAFNGMYKDRLANRATINRCLLIFAIFNRFKSFFGNQRLNYYTKREMAQYDFFPRPLPQAYITVKNEGKDDDQYFLELFDASTQNKKHWQRLKFHMDQSDSGNWEAAGRDYPDLLLICETPQVERLVQRLAEKMQASTGADMAVYTTSYNALLNARSLNDEIWSNIDEPEELVNLNQVSASKTV